MEERDVGSERGQRAKQQGAVPLAAKSVCEGTRVGGVHAPFAAVQRNGFKMDKLGKDGSRRLRTPAFQARITVRRVAHQRQIVGDRCRRDAELLDDTSFV